MENDIRRLTRIIFSDIVIYGPEKADRAIRENRFKELYKVEIEEGRKMIRSRFSTSATAIETFERVFLELLEVRRKELEQPAIAL